MKIKDLAKAGSKLGTIAVVTVMMIGCGEGLNRFNDRKVLKAPVNDDEAGIVVVDASTDNIEKFLDKHPEVTFRPLILGDQSTLVEFFGTSQETIKDEFSRVETFKNSITKFEQPKTTDWIAKAAEFNPVAPVRSNPVVKAEPKPANADSVSELDPETCLRARIAGPNAILSWANRDTQSASLGYVKIDQKIKLSSAGSSPSPGVGGSLKHAWMFIPPEGSFYSLDVTFKPTLEFKPDMVGLFTVALIVQDESGYCSAASEDFLVAENPEILKADRPLPFTSDLSLFPHAMDLKLIDTRKIATGLGKVIAVIDSGVNYNHPALRSNMLLNDKDPVNGLDDDKNGLVDDQLGYDFAHGDRYPYDDVGHGSMVAGMAASSWIGVAPNAKILAIKSTHMHGSDFATLTAAIKYAVDRKVDVINLSLGAHSRPPSALVKEIDRAEKEGVIIVAAAGNGDYAGVGVNTDLFPHYPSSLPNENIISVAARDHTGLMTSYSNYGATSVDVVAVGGSPENPVKSVSVPNPRGLVFMETVGTSFASPVVAGIAAAVLEVAPKLTPAQVKQLLLKSGQEEAFLKDRLVSGRVLSLQDALAKIKGL